MFKKYDLEIKKILALKSSDSNWKEILENHKDMISKIQHERLVPLLVTIFTGTVMTSTFFVALSTDKLVLYFLDIALIALFFGYIIHYQFLENMTQKWYKVEEEIKKLI